MFQMSTGCRAPLRVTIAGLIGAGALAIASPAEAQEPCFQRLDNGVDYTGWTRSTTNHHGPAQGWTIEDGAMVGRQTAGQLGGIMMTDKSYSDVEVLLEVKIDWMCDSGIFFRTTAGDRAYQVNVDHLTGGGIGTIYGESFTTELRARDYTLTNQGNTAIVEPGHTPIFDLAKWPMIWHPTEFNEIRARVEGNPPHIQVWIAGTKVMDFTDSQLRSEINPSGPLAIQVHSGDRFVAGGAVRYRNIRAKDLTVACVSPVDAGPRPPLPDSAAASDAPSIPVADGAPMMGNAMDAVVPSDPGQGTGTGTGAGTGTGTGTGGVAPESAPASADSGGCACVTSRSAGDAGASPVLILFALAGVRRSARRYPRSKSR
jgi:Domain of Unknown Function (DUF1080)